MRRMILIPVIFVLLIVEPVSVYAQLKSSGYASSVPLKESTVEGDVICSYKDGFKKCQNEYDTSIYGVVTNKASVEIKDNEIKDSKLVLTNGITMVRVSGINGNIVDGDFITSSKNAGLGQKATRNGYILGTALEGFDFTDSNQIAEIQVALNIHPASGLASGGSNLLQYIREGLAVPLFEPLASLRYLLAVLMIIISFTLGMVYFGRSTRAGIEAIGRNPLAKKVIQLTIIINIVLTIVIVLVGLGIAYLILVL